jgi:hypothetical protein
MPIRIDDPNLSDNDTVYRRIWNTPQWTDLKALEEGTLRPSSVAFLDPNNEVSVSVTTMTTPELMLANYPTFGLVQLRVGVPRSVDHIVSATPEILDDTAHRAICPPADSTKSSRKTAARRMAAEIEWVVKPLGYREDSHQA